MAQQDPILALSVYDVSSYDPAYPPQIVLQGNPLSPGWRTALNAQMPSHITIQLADGLCELSMVQFVTHETLIPASVEILVSQQCPPVDWTRLGHVKMGEQKVTRARDRKTFKFKINAKLIKFQINQVLGHSENTTGQISLASIVVRGQKIQEAQPEPEEMQNEHIQRGDKYKAELQIMKTEAIKANQFLQANRYKLAYQKISDLQTAIEQLETKKAAAINREDYVAAHTMKESIEQLQAILGNKLEDLVCILNGEEIPKPPEPKKAAYVQPAQVQVQVPVQQVQGNEQRMQSPALQNGSEAPVQQPKQVINMSEDLSKAIPVQKQDDSNIPHGEKPLVNVEANQEFKLSDEEKAQYEEEARQRALQMKKKKELELKRKRGEAVDEEEEVEDKKQAKQNIPEGQHQTRFNQDKFAFQQQMDLLTTNWNKDATPPPRTLPAELERSVEVSILRGNGFNDTFLNLAGSKNVDHVLDAILFMICCLKLDMVKYSESSIALVNMIGQNVNVSLFAFANQLVCYAYQSLLIKYAPSSVQAFKIGFDFPNVDTELVNQKDNALIYAEMTIKFVNKQKIDVEKALIQAMGRQVQAFNTECQQLWQQMIARVAAQQKRVKATAINMLATLASFVCFPILNLTSTLVKKQNIDRISQLKPNEQNFTNNKYFSIIEARATALSAILKINYSLTPQIIPQLMELIKWVFPTATKAEFKKSMLDIIVLLYETDAAAELIQILNQCIKNSALYKQIQKQCSDSDQERGGRARVSYVDQDGGRLILDGQQQYDQIQTDFPPGTCQFCLWESTDPSNPDVLWSHLMKDCPCCCVCPACHLVVEIPVLPEHMCSECQQRNQYQFKLKACPKCRTVVDEKGYNEHVGSCQAVLIGDQAQCPLCNILLKDTEDALDHYAEKRCEANPRCTERLRKIVETKVMDSKPQNNDE
ncbi:Glycine- [Hexamita inflata]|uniref:Glutamate n=1 Tax=Hexamita inflata TaxID=28002 RepID=A0AA86RBR7_9EUKA|nr:Glycine- [Hexamita inflata]